MIHYHHHHHYLRERRTHESVRVERAAVQVLQYVVRLRHAATTELIV